MIAFFDHLHNPIKLLLSLRIGLVLLGGDVFLFIEVAIAVFLFLPVVVMTEGDLVLEGLLINSRLVDCALSYLVVFLAGRFLEEV